MKCTWCDEKSVIQVELEPARRGIDKRTGKMVTKKLAKLAPACSYHRDIIDWQPPFYTCGCSYVEGELRCPRHDSLLRQPHRNRLTKELIKDAKRST